MKGRTLVEVVLFALFIFSFAAYSQSYFDPAASKLSLSSHLHSGLSLTVNSDYSTTAYENPAPVLLQTEVAESDNLADTLTEAEQDAQARRLLPEDMSWMENILWGVHGVFTSEPLDRTERKNELGLRRTMLTWHQRLGLTTWVLMGATVLAGQLTLNGNERFRSVHSPLADATIIGYSATALLAILAPPPLIRREGEHGTVFYHKLLAWVHAAGMILLPILANNIFVHSFEKGARGPRQIDVARARAHQITGYITFATFTASVLTIVF